jgi:predicted TIM-barrel fold metal-dependent hydrolase
MLRIKFLVLVSTVMLPVAANAQATAETRKLAAEVPIADMHMHLTKDLTPDKMRAQMDANKVKWGGAVGGVAPGQDVSVYAKALGERYIPAGGQQELFRIYRDKGPDGTTDTKNPIFRRLADSADAQFKSGLLRGFGELFVNNRRSHPDPTFRRKIATDSPTFRELYAIAARHGGFVQIHMEGDDDSLAQLDNLIASAGPVTIILSHCMVTASRASVRKLLERYPSAYCELSARGAPVLGEKHPLAGAIRIYDLNGIQGEWLKFIEAMPDRFMIGSDAIHESYDDIIRSYRTNFLPYLKPDTMRKVAYENAQRVFKLK